MSGRETLRRFDLFAALALALIAAGLYLPSLGANFVYDARGILLANDYVHHLRNLADVLTLRVLRMDVMDNNRPVYLVSAMLDWALWGANPAGHHFMSIAWHAVATVLLFALCRRVADGVSPWIPFAAALLFAVHPVNCEPVAEVSYRKDLIAAAGVLAALNLATFFRPEFSRRNVWIAIACIASLILAVGAKENGVAGPPILICYWLLFRRNEPRAGWIALCAAAMLVVGGFLVARFALPPKTSIIFTDKPQYPGGSLAAAMMIQPRILAFYFRQMVWPRDLSADYGPYAIRNFGIETGLAALIVVLIAQFVIAMQNRVFALGAVMFWCAMLPVSNLVPIYRPMADRFLYLPMAGVALILASIPCRRKAAGWIVAAVALPVAVAFSAVTFQREKVWRDSLALWTDTVQKDPALTDAPNNLGSAFYGAGRFAEAVTAFELAIRNTKGKQADPFAGMALALDAMGRTAEADAAFQKAAKLDARFTHPGQLVQALIWEKTNADKLQKIADRNRVPPEKSE